MSEAVVTPVVTVVQAMSPSALDYPDAVWIGTVDDNEFLNGRVVLEGLSGYRSLRLLVRSGRVPRGFIELPIEHGAFDSAHAAAAIASLPDASARGCAKKPPISVVLCTYDRPVALTTALRSLLELDYPSYEIVLVDNNPASGLTAAAIEGFDDPRIRLVLEPRRGLSRARNTGALAARNSILAFTDDDVVMDREWLHGIADGFGASADVACVSGIVPTGEIASSAQTYFDRRVSWARSCRAEVFSLAQPPVGESLFPFQVARFGTGANFALRKSVLLDVGGFDEGLGVGSECGGGEDIDMFVRILLAGHQLAYEPSALVWHRHRREVDSLVVQLANYGTGLGAWLTKLTVHPRTLVMVARRTVPGLRHLRHVTYPSTPSSGPPSQHRTLWRVELRAVFRGPYALVRARASGARSRPLATPPRAAYRLRRRPTPVEHR